MLNEEAMQRLRFVLLGLLLVGLLWALFGCAGAAFDLRPTAVAKAAPDSGEVPLTVRFDGSASTAVAGKTIVAYNWDFGDGSTGAGAITTHTYNTKGIITAVLTVTDSAGLSGTDKVFIDARGPSIVFSSGRDLNMIEYLPPEPDLWNWLAYLCPIARFLDLWKMNSDGSGLARLTKTMDAGDVFPDLNSKTRDRVTFTRINITDPDACTTYEIDVYTMDADGSNLVNLTPDTASFDAVSTFSPDATKIAFTSTRDCPNPKDLGIPCADVFVMNADGTNPVKLTTTQADVFNGYPDWSPKGDKIAFISNVTGNNEVWVMNADGTGLQQLTNDPADDGGCMLLCSPPSWSPDGTKIAWSTNRSGTYEIWVMNADGTNQTQVTNTPGYESLMPYWLPNGQEIAYTHWIDMPYGSWSLPGPPPNETIKLPQLFKVDLGSGISTQLTDITWNLAPGSESE